MLYLPLEMLVFWWGKRENLEKPLEARVTTDYKIMKINNVLFVTVPQKVYKAKFSKMDV